MAAINFPSSPSNGATHTANGVTWTYETAKGVWRASTFADAPTGDKGEKGQKGATGATGAKGSTGSTGAKGEVGATGAKGSTGATGAKGSTGGTGATGSKGEVGATGSQGSTGSKGQKGEDGGDADTVDGIQAASFLRSDANDSFSGELTSTNRSNGIFGTYNSVYTDHIWSMGTAYKNASNGSNFGNLYGLAYKHTNNGTGGTMAGGHQAVWCTNGTPRAAMGESGFWTGGTFSGTATSARWADLAERYHADAIYGAGIVLGVGGVNEVTEYQPGMALAGAVSAEPGFRMNDHDDQRDAPDSTETLMNPFVALKGRIPVAINGSANKGDMIYADCNGRGVAKVGNEALDPLLYIGVALESGTDLIEVKV